jgi:hypothetical protein
MQTLVVALIVAVAMVYAAASYLPRAWRELIVFFLSRRGLNQARMAAFFNTEASCGSGCGSCGSGDGGCGADAAPALNLGEDEPRKVQRIIKIHPRS